METNVVDIEDVNKKRLIIKARPKKTFKKK